ncbi:MAG: L-aspartate oxidase [Alphaproteobacteria bacterium]|nr:MAG: L-aspartate oxidase [Alphaproteobacteria bacterium]
MKPFHTDVVILGAGISGLMTALALKPLRVAVLTPTPLGQGCATSWAQGGIAAALSKDDSALAHAVDTIAVAGGISDRAAIDMVTSRAETAIKELVRLGVVFDQDNTGEFALTREAAHQVNRILHCGGDRTGAEIMRALITAVTAAPHASILEGYSATGLAATQGSVKGVLAVAPDGTAHVIHAKATVLATGGIGHLYAKTTNPVFANGDGMAMAARAGAVIADPEFVQFHPTALDVDQDPLPLVSEAVRGEGALLVDETGTRFMNAIHPLGELAPRDVVARAIWRQQKAGHKVYLDARKALRKSFEDRFPQVHASCRQFGIDPATDLIPITPAAHYHMGGVMIDLFGRTSLKGLWACGEVASSGMHGANRLASNSLLEGAVFSRQIAASIHRAAVNWPKEPASPFPHQSELDAAADPQTSQAIRELMYANVALERCAEGLADCLMTLTEMERATPLAAQGTRNMLTAAQIIAAAAYLREESRGGHFRSDFPASLPQGQRTLITLRDVEELTRSLETKAA